MRKKKLSNGYTKKSRKKLYGCYNTYRIKNGPITFQQYLEIHEQQVLKTNKVTWLV